MNRAAWPERRVEDWAQLQAEFDRLSGRCVFRGQDNRNWPLVAGFNRLLSKVTEEQALAIEHESIIRFRSEAHLHLQTSVLPPNYFKLDALDTYVEWLALMQHYGAPTRLVDWTWSGYVALYFATIQQSAHDAAIWYFENAPVPPYHHATNEFLDYADFKASEVRCVDGDEVVLFTAVKKLRTQREIAQQGSFTLPIY